MPASRESQNVYLKIEKIFNYSPLDPAPDHSYSYRRDCFRRDGHEDGTIVEDEVEQRMLTAVVYRQYTDDTYSTVDTSPLIPSDIAEPPPHRRVPGAVIYTKPGVRLFIHVLNGDDQPHSLHMHGIQYGIDSDGAYPLGLKNIDNVRSDQICPGRNYTYRYDVTPDMTGAWVFHDHFQNIGENARRGLIGGLVVRDPSWPQADYEIPFFMHVMAGRRGRPFFDSGDILPGQSYPRRFDVAEDYAYECFYHPMFGRVRVTEGRASSATVLIKENTFEPAEVEIRPGGIVTWNNVGESTHTVLEAGNSESKSTHAINGRAFAGNTPVIEVEAGKRIRWYIFNLDLQQAWHNFHPHASHWMFGGQNLDNRSIGPAEAFVVDTIVPPVLLPPNDEAHLEGEKETVSLAAIFPVHCHVEPHVMGGMVALMRVTQELAITRSYRDSLEFPLPVDGRVFECPVPDENLCIDTVDNGTWSELKEPPVFAVHGALLNTGKVMMWSGHAELGTAYPLNTALYDPESNDYSVVPFSDAEDLFCAGHAFLADGRVVAGGGANKGQVKSTHVFDPARESWSRLAGGELRDFRWYPTMITMADGRIAIVSGTNGLGTVDKIEVLDLSKSVPPPGVAVHYWELVVGSEKSFSGLYPGLHWLPSGDMFFSRTGWNSHGGLGPKASMFRFNGPLSGTWIDSAPMAFPDRKEGCSVLIIDDTGGDPTAKVFVAGGRSAVAPAIKECEIIDVNDPAAPVEWRTTKAMTHARVGNSAVVLPNGKVLVIGGRQTSGRFDESPVFVYECEMYDPITDSWAVTPPMNHPRQYHSVAILLPDGRVLTSGGVDASRGKYSGVYDPGDNQLTSEAYSPEYLCNQNRPEITMVPGSANYGSTITIQLGEPISIDSVCLVSPGAMTHHTDTQQRYIKLSVMRRDQDSLDVRMPRDGNTAPPGYYMVFVVSDVGVPSLGRFVRLL